MTIVKFYNKTQKSVYTIMFHNSSYNQILLTMLYLSLYLTENIFVLVKATCMIIRKLAVTLLLLLNQIFFRRKRFFYPSYNERCNQSELRLVLTITKISQYFKL